MDYGLIVDTETTGLDPAKDRIIELGLLEFAVEGDQPPVITRMYSALQQPGELELLPEIVRLTGLNDRVLKGQAVDWEYARGFFSRASVVIAHNAAFDRAFLKAAGVLNGLSPHWACSSRHIDWRKHNCRTTALNYLAADHGFVNPFAHRALFDCATTFRLIAPHLQELLARSWEREFLIRALSSPFDSKDALKARGYRWDGGARHWYRTVAEGELAAEREFLATEVYRGEPRHSEEEIGLDRDGNGLEAE